MRRRRRGVGVGSRAEWRGASGLRAARTASGARGGLLRAARRGVVARADGLPDAADRDFEVVFETLRPQGLNADRPPASRLVTEEGVRLWQRTPSAQAMPYPAHGLPDAMTEILVLQTSGDRIQDRALSEAGGKGLFTKEIEEALLDGRADVAVHSAKDMPTVLPDGLILTAFLEREDVRDVFLSRVAGSIADLPQGAVVGTASLRPQALVRRARAR